VQRSANNIFVIWDSVKLTLNHALLMMYDMIYLNVIGSTPDGSSTLHIYTKTNTQDNTMKHNTQIIICMTIRIHKHNNKNTQFTQLTEAYKTHNHI
jgi:hypothetical protein